MQTRLNVVKALFILAFVFLLGRLFFWQIIKASELSTQARVQYSSTQGVAASRGSIFASDESWLAAGVDSWLVYVSKSDLKDSVRTVANRLAPFFIEETDDHGALLDEAMRLEGLLTESEAQWVPLKSRLTTDVKKNIEALRISGVGFERRETRAYPEASAAAHLLGFVGKDEEGLNKGYFGIEGYYDLSLSGKAGFKSRESDAAGIPILFGSAKEAAAVSGVSLVTHLDKRVQLIIEEKLAQSLEKYGAVSGSVVVANPSDGAVVAMASSPSYDPQKYYEYGDEFFKNPVVSDSFEPGSIFKPLVVAAALDAGVVEPSTKCDICDGPLEVDKYLIETWNQKYRPEATVTDIVIHSDNVGMVFIGRKLGADKLFDYLDSYGFGQLTEVDLQGEATPLLREKKAWSEVDLATASFGQGIAVTPIQMIKAMSIIANGGFPTKPQIVDKLSLGVWEDDVEVEIAPRVISEKTAREVAGMMVLAAKEGEAKWTALRGFKIAGKTGTAQIPVKGHYDEEKTIASYIGFAPATNPKFIMLVTLREPQSSPWAAETAAPLWFSITKELIPYYGIQPEN